MKTKTTPTAEMIPDARLPQTPRDRKAWLRTLRRQFEAAGAQVLSASAQLIDDDNHRPAALAQAADTVRTAAQSLANAIGTRLQTISAADASDPFCVSVATAAHALANDADGVYYTLDELELLDRAEFSAFAAPIVEIRKHYQAFRGLCRQVESGAKAPPRAAPMAPGDAPPAPSTAGPAAVGATQRAARPRKASPPRAASRPAAASSEVPRPTEATSPASSASPQGAKLDLEASALAPPRQPSTAPAVVASPTSDQPAPMGRILVAEDNPTSRDRLSGLLTSLGHQVHAVADGRAALEALIEQPAGNQFDLVLADIRMEPMNGLELLAEVRSYADLRDIPVVMVSSLDDIETVAAAIAHGADDYLPKPVDRQLLQARIASCLMRSQHKKRELELRRELEQAKKRADRLFREIFPDPIAQELGANGTVRPRRFNDVAVLFCDVVGFTSFCDVHEPDDVVKILDKLFVAYEEIAQRHRVQKIKTIGDCFMATAGLLEWNDNPVLACVKCGNEMIQAVKACHPDWQVRAGIHIGPVVAGLAGRRQHAFDLWGDTVNTASRVESAGEPGRVCMSAAAASRIETECRCKSLGLKSIHGKHPTEIFRFESFRDANA